MISKAISPIFKIFGFGRYLHNYIIVAYWPILGLCFTFVGCIELRDRNQKSEDNSGPSAPVESENSSAKHLLIIKGDEINDYKVQINLPPSLKSEELEIKRDILDPKLIGKFKEGNWKEIVLPSAGTIVDSDVAPEQELRYSFRAKDKGSFRLLFEEKIKIPYDLEITDDQVLVSGKTIPLSKFASFPVELEAEKKTEKSQIDSKFYSVGRIYFSQGAKLFTMGQDINLDVDEIHSKGAELGTFPSGSKAFLNVEGRGGGRLIVNVNKLIGPLNVSARGEAGGDGLNGKEPGAELNGAAGRKGENFCTPNLTEVHVCNGAFIENKDANCNYPDLKGESGSPGLKGYPGTNGRRGGDTGSIGIRIRELQNEDLIWMKEAGMGGEGGRGGIGGAGGPGGAPGTIRNYSGQDYCVAPGNERQRGSPGSRGETGDSGRGGLTGNLGSICVNDKCY